MNIQDIENSENEQLQTRRQEILEDFDMLSTAQVTDEEYWRVWHALNRMLTLIEQELRMRGII
tara:strand:+ start:3557 stop:3745 length:189 start_codon:yes stop_codon:yes gene_type:complete